MDKTFDKYLISEYNKIDVDRRLIFEAEQKNEDIIMVGILQKANTLNRNGRIYPYEILKREAERYMEQVEEATAGGECVPAGTGIFTKNGWKNIEDIKIGEEIFTFNLEENKLEIQKVEKTIKKPYNDKMVHIYNNKIDMMVTKGHKVVLWDKHGQPYTLTAEELYNKIKSNDAKVFNSCIKNSATWKGEEPEFFNLPGTDIKIKTEDWAAFLGIYISEGHCAGTKGGYINNEVGITQTKSDGKILIENLLNKLPFKYVIEQNRQYIINNKDLHDHLFALGNSGQKYIPDYAKNWSVKLLNVLLDWLLIGDGKNRKGRDGELMKEYFTVSKKLSEDIFEIMLKIGNGATTSTIIPKDRQIEGRTILAENSQKLYLIHQRTISETHFNKGYINAELVDFNDNVFCVTIPNGTWLMKNNLKCCWTGNCDHPSEAIVSLERVSHRVLDMWWQGEELWGKVMVAYTPMGELLKGLLKTGFKLGISSRGVGSVKNVKGNDIVQDDFELIAFDFVSSPSTPGAYMFKESVQRGMRPLTTEEYKVVRGVGNTLLKESKTDLFGQLQNIYNNNFWKK